MTVPDHNEEITTEDDTRWPEEKIRVESSEIHGRLEMGMVEADLWTNDEPDTAAFSVKTGGYSPRVVIGGDSDGDGFYLSMKMSPEAADAAAEQLKEMADYQREHRKDSDYFDEEAGARKSADDDEPDGQSFLRKLIS